MSIDSDRFQPKLLTTLLKEDAVGTTLVKAGLVLSTLKVVRPVIPAGAIWLPAMSLAFTESVITPSMVSSPALLSGIA